VSTKYILQSTKPGGPCFDILSYDPETKTGKLKGTLGAEFEHDMSKEHLTKYGYKVVPKPTGE